MNTSGLTIRYEMTDCGVEGSRYWAVVLLGPASEQVTVTGEWRDDTAEYDHEEGQRVITLTSWRCDKEELRRDLEIALDCGLLQEIEQSIAERPIEIVGPHDLPEVQTDDN